VTTVSATADAVVDLSIPDDVRVVASDEEAITAAAAFADAIRPGAISRDREGRLPHEELRELVRSGLLAMRVPRSHGGAGVRNTTVAEVFRLISAADPAVGQIPQKHVAFVDTIIRYGTAGQQDFFLAEFLRGARLGNALSERGGRTSRDWVTRIARQADGSHRLNGRKYYSTGALTAQWVPVFALDDDDQIAVAYVPRDAPGLEVDQDWTAFGQRATVSGTTTLEDVDVRPEWVVHGALARSEPNTFGGETALRVATEIFDFSGSSAADGRHGLDRHWRNARTHTLHDPARSKHLHLGRHLVDGVAPPSGHALV
jgi:alkylation response protein AidB-like acyl-CoA dehydrogenase